jgi:hypothetical protein
MKAAADAAWSGVVPLDDVIRHLIRTAPEMARFKFCKGTLLDSHALPCATGARQKTLPCGFCPGAHQRAHDAFLLGKDLCLAPLGKTTHDVGLCRAQNVTHNKEKGSTAVPQRDGVTRSLPCATQILMAQKKEKKARQAGARLRQAMTTPPPATGPPFPTPAKPPPPHAGRTARSAATSPRQLCRELGPSRE